MQPGRHQTLTSVANEANRHGGPAFDVMGAVAGGTITPRSSSSRRRITHPATWIYRGVLLAAGGRSGGPGSVASTISTRMGPIYANRMTPD
jgi:hypothetical protein